jgi:hypothetical protein
MFHPAYSFDKEVIDWMKTVPTAMCKISIWVIASFRKREQLALSETVLVSTLCTPNGTGILR